MQGNPWTEQADMQANHLTGTPSDLTTPSQPPCLSSPIACSNLAQSFFPYYKFQALTANPKISFTSYSPRLEMHCQLLQTGNSPKIWCFHQNRAASKSYLRGAVSPHTMLLLKRIRELALTTIER